MPDIGGYATASMSEDALAERIDTFRQQARERLSQKKPTREDVPGMSGLDRDRQQSRVDAQLEHATMLVLRMPYFLQQLEGLAERIEGPEALNEQPSSEEPECLDRTTLHAKLDYLTHQTEKAINRLAIATERLERLI